jgi:hypothetical protein
MAGTGRPGLSMKNQYAVLVHHHPTVGGVSRLQPPLDDLLEGPASPLSDRALQSQAIGFARGLGIRYVFVRPAIFTDPAVASGLMRALENSDVVRPMETFDEVFAFEIAPGTYNGGDDSTLARVPRESLVLNASRNADRAPLAVDGDTETRWLSGAPQSGREWLEVAFDRPRDVARIDFVTSRRSLHDFPRRLEIVATRFSVGAEQSVLYSGSVLEQYGRAFLRSPELPAISFDLPSHLSTRLLIRQTGRAAPWYWSVDELVIWERPSPR